MPSALLPSHVDEQQVDSWKTLLTKIDEMFRDPDKWIFRGMRDANYSLLTSLDRALDAADLPRADANVFEGRLLRGFQRQAHQYLRQPPDSRNILAWFALMQHFGASTRLLDWTHSVYVAAYFAASDVVLRPKGGSSCVIWAIDWDWLEREAKYAADFKTLYDKDLNWEDNANFERLRKWQPAILKANSFAHNERVAIQQGTFLMQTDVTKTWEENFLASLPTGPSSPHVKRLLIRPEARNSILRGLFRMNIHHGTLFPGLDGFARSLQSSLVSDALRPHPWW